MDKFDQYKRLLRLGIAGIEIFIETLFFVYVWDEVYRELRVTMFLNKGNWMIDVYKRQGYQFSSANSINIGRLVPQIVYYVYAYAKLLESGEIKDGEIINVTVPTGNFGNILAAYYAKQMGIPIGKLICASNDNKVLYDFFRTGEYDRNRPFILTTSPSMDILISSNLERLI